MAILDFRSGHRNAQKRISRVVVICNKSKHQRQRTSILMGKEQVSCGKGKQLGDKGSISSVLLQRSLSRQKRLVNGLEGSIDTATPTSTKEALFNT